MGEASVAMVVTQQSCDAYMKILGGAMTQDAFHVCSLEPTGSFARTCFERALEAAGVSSDEVNYVNAHGTGTTQCDNVEGAVIEELFGPDTGVFALKPLLGHCQGAAAATEIVISCIASERGVIPAPPVFAKPKISGLIDGHVPYKPGITLKSSLGFGGNNSALVLQTA